MGAISIPAGSDPGDAGRLEAATHTSMQTFTLSRVVLVFFGIIVLSFVLLEFPWTAFRLSHYGATGWAFSSKPKRNHNFSSAQSHQDVAGTSYISAATLPRRIGRLPHAIPTYIVPKVNLSLAQVVVLLLAFVLVMIASFVNSNWLTDSTRTGYIAITLVPCVIALGNKVFGVGTFLAVGYASVNWAHRWLGRLVFLVATVHAIAYYTIFIQTHSFKAEMSKPVNIMATISYAGFCLIFGGSIGIVRRRSWQLFKICHHFGIFLFIAGLNYHSTLLRPWVLFSVLAIGISAVSRILTSRLHVAYLVALPSSTSTIVHLPSVRSGWLPGQSVRLRVLTGGMGLDAIWEGHPFTLITVPSVAEGSDGDGAKLVVKAVGDWTKKLFAVAAKRPGGDAEESRKSRGYPVAVLIEGPYGGCNLVYSAYGSVLLAAGGSGVSYVLGAANGIIADCKAGKAVTRNLNIVWTVRDRAAINDLLLYFEELLEKGKSLQLRIVITLYFTSVSRGLIIRPFSIMPTSSMFLHNRHAPAPVTTPSSGFSNPFTPNGSSAALLALGNTSTVDLPPDRSKNLAAPPQFIIGHDDDGLDNDSAYEGVDLDDDEKKNPFSDFYAPPPPSPTTKPRLRAVKPKTVSSPPIELKPGRPEYNHILQHIIESEQAHARSFLERFQMVNGGHDALRGSGTGRIAVGACGPPGMVASLRALCYDAHGVEFHAEEFSL